MVTREDWNNKVIEFFQPVTDQITSELESIKENEASLDTEIGELRGLYHEEFAGRLRSMQAELDHYHDLDKGRVYDGILADIARIYDNYENLPVELEAIPEDVRNGSDLTSVRQICRQIEDVHYLLSDLRDLLIQYGAAPIRSEPGAMRDLQHTQIIQRVPTDDPARHLTIAQSYNTGFRIDKRTIIKEQVSVYQYQAPAPVPETAAVAIEQTAAVIVRQTTIPAADGNDHGTAASVAAHDAMNKEEG